MLKETMKLNNQNLPSLAAHDDILVGGYDRQNLKAGIVHLGLGNFHRAHLAWYLDRLFATGEGHDWAIIGAGVLAKDAEQRKKFLAQDCLSSLIELDPNKHQARILSSMIDYIAVEQGNAPLIAAMAREEIRIVSLTVTEGGYYINPALGAFDPDHPDMQRDASQPEAPGSVFGAIIKALMLRREAGIAPFTVLSCDNLPENGRVAKDAIVGLAKLSQPDFAEWIESNVSFPSSMVDCITPATGEREIALAASFGIDDAVPVVCEPFRQWVVEDDFCNGRPNLEKVGVTFTDKVKLFELMKLRILNGGHAAIAYAAALLDIEYVHEAMQNNLILAFLDKLEKEEVIPTLQDVPDTNLNDYYRVVVERFSNPAIGDTIPRLCLDGSNRQPKFILPTIMSGLKNGTPVSGLALVTALWCRYCTATSDSGKSIVVEDDRREQLFDYASRAKTNPVSFLQQKDIYGDLAENELFCQQFSQWLTKLWEDGVKATLSSYANVSSEDYSASSN